jgi:formylglycine-generating enzyme required for sulfatase activity
MRIRFSTLMALLVMLITLTGCSERAMADAANNESSDITLIPYINEDFGISGFVPEGWLEVKPGQFLRMPDTDPTLLGQVAFHGVTMDQVATKMQLPESVGSMETPGLIWDLYGAELEWPEAGTLALDIALSKSDSGVYLVVLVTLADEHESLHEAVFVPSINALAPAMVTSDREAATSAIPLIQLSEPIDTRIRPADGMTMVYVPAGEFEMGHKGTQWMWSGSLIGGDLGLQVFTDERPQHAVYLDAFWIDQTEVTVAMFRTFVEAMGYKTTAEREGWGAPWTDGPMEEEWPHVSGTDWQHPHGPGSSALDDHPVVQVSWEDAAAYCAWAGGQLPTEAQWELAARGTDGRLWPWGDTYEGNRGSFCDASCPVKRWNHDSYNDGYALTSPVGSFPSGASPYGALDMAGNVWEWVADWYDEDYYSDSPYENPTGPSSGIERTQRGGAWIDNESWVRTTVRHATSPGVRCDDLGFRCAVPAE